MPNKINEKGITFDDVLLVPKYSEIESRLSDKLDLSANLTKKIRINIPFVSSPMLSVTDLNFAYQMKKIGGEGVVHRFMPKEKQIPFPPDKPDSSLICAVGLNDRDRIEFLYSVGHIRTFLIDVASGHNKLVGDEIKYIKDKYHNVEVIAGNVVTSEATNYLIECGVDALRIGVGNGGACKTRIATGCGVSQLTAIKWCSEGSQGRVPIISDGGTKNSGDCVKALSFGADAIMSGLLFTQFSNAGKIVTINNIKYKNYLGQASEEFQNQYYHGMKRGTAAEGVSLTLPMRYDIDFETFMGELTGGIRSAMSYLGCYNLKDLRNVDYLEVSETTKIENYPRDFRT